MTTCSADSVGSSVPGRGSRKAPRSPGRTSITIGSRTRRQCSIARFEGSLIGAYYLKPNFVGRAAHIANAGYFVLAPYRNTGVGRTLVEHSLREARRLGFDAMMFNLVFESNSARSMYRRLGFEEIGRIPGAIEGEDAVMYWRSLEDVES